MNLTLVNTVGQRETDLVIHPNQAITAFQAMCLTVSQK